MTVAIVQSVKYVPGAKSNSGTITLSSTPTAGNLLIAFIAFSQYSEARSLTPPTGFTLIDSDTQGNDSLASFWKLVETGDGTGYAYSISGSNEWHSAVMYEISGADINAPINAHSVAKSATNPITTTEIVSYASGQLALTGCTCDNKNQPTVSAGWTVDQYANPLYHYLCASSRNALTSNPITGITNTFTFSGNDTFVALAILIGENPQGAVPTILNLCEYATNTTARAACDNHILTPIMTSNTAPSGVASADSEIDGTRKAWRAFDRSNINDEADCWHSTNSAYPHWVKYQFPQKEVVRAYSIACRGDSKCITTWKLQGSNDNSNWDDLDTQTSISWSLARETKIYTFSNSTPYTYYRIYATAGNHSNYAVIGELGLYMSNCSHLTKLITTMTADNAPSPLVASASSWETASGANPYRAFQYNVLSPADSDAWVTNSTNTGWLKIDLGSGNAVIANKYTIHSQNWAGGPARAPKAWTFDGSNDDTNWTTIDTQTGQTGWAQNEQRTYQGINTAAFRYYRINVTENNTATSVSIARFLIYEAPIVASSESTIKHGGDYSLKLNVSTNALNKSIHVSLSAVDISAKNRISFWVRTSRTGSNLKFGFMDSGGVITEVTPNIVSADTFQEVTVNLTEITDANIDAIRKVIITCLNADAANTVYVDNMVADESLVDPDETGGGLLVGANPLVGGNVLCGQGCLIN